MDLTLGLDPRTPEPASVLSACMNTTESFDSWSCLLSVNTGGANASILLDGPNVGVRPQNLQVGVGKGSSKTVDDGPLVCNLGLGAELAGDGGDTSTLGNAVLESHDVTPVNSVLVPCDGHEGGGSREDRENTEGESDELLGEHGGCLELASTSELRLPHCIAPRI